MALQDLMELSLSKGGKKMGLSEERIREQLPVIREYIAYWREYPDMFVEFLCGENNPENFHLFFYQRLFLKTIFISHLNLGFSPRYINISMKLYQFVLYLHCNLRKHVEQDRIETVCRHGGNVVVCTYSCAGQGLRCVQSHFKIYRTGRCRQTVRMVF